MAAAKVISVKAFPRIHVGLIDLGNATPRKNGGAGFVLNCIPTEIVAKRGRSTVNGLTALDRRGQKDVIAAIRRMRVQLGIKQCSITICSLSPQHVGLGSKTALILAILKAHAVLAKRRVSSNSLQALSGRGGTSGIGVHGFFQGGFLVDAGHATEGSHGYAPSSFRKNFDIPPLSTRVAIPTRWRFALFLPRGVRFSGIQEMEFFRKNTPVPKSEVTQTMSLVYQEIIPAVVQDDIVRLSSALQKMHECGFKRREIEDQQLGVKRLYAKFIGIRGCAVGLSSMGPLIYVIMKEPSKKLIADLTEIARHEDATLLALCRGRNSGHKVTKK